MKSIFEKSTREEVLNRVNALSEKNTAQWGTMNLYQMLKHCTLWEEMILGDKVYKTMFLGRLFGKIALKKVLKDQAPLRKGTPTLPHLTIKETKGDIGKQKSEWIEKIRQYEHFNKPELVHVFFGKMTKEQVGEFVYKHMDHHLRQFNA